MRTYVKSDLKELEGKEFANEEECRKAEAQVKAENEAKAKAEAEAKKAAEAKKKEQDKDLQELVNLYNKLAEAETAYLEAKKNVLKKYGSVRLVRDEKGIRAEIVNDRPFRFCLGDLFATPAFDEVLEQFLK